MNGKVCVITGANAGIGFETAKALAKKGGTIAMVCRNKTKGNKALESIKTSFPNANISLFIADMGSQQQIRDVAKKISTQYEKVDVLVNNAGTWVSEQIFTEDGVESVFAINHLAYILLTHELYPLLRKAEEGRIVNVSSDSHFNGKVDFDNLYLDGTYNGLKSYALSKLGNVLFTYELDQRKPDAHITINALQPGLVKTDIGLKHTKWLHGFVWKLRRSGGVSPAEGAKTSIYLASSDAAKGVSGKYWDKCKPKPSSKLSYDTEVSQKMWEKSLELLGITDFFGRA